MNLEKVCRKNVLASAKALRQTQPGVFEAQQRASVGEGRWAWGSGRGQACRGPGALLRMLDFSTARV